MNEQWHGTLNGYRYHKCRCEACGEARREYFNKRPGAKEKRAAYYRRPEVKARRAAYYRRPEVKAKSAAYARRFDVRNNKALRPGAVDRYADFIAGQVEWLEAHGNDTGARGRTQASLPVKHWDERMGYRSSASEKVGRVPVARSRSNQMSAPRVLRTTIRGRQVEITWDGEDITVRDASTLRELHLDSVQFLEAHRLVAERRTDAM
jgi:hypothetical protein